MYGRILDRAWEWTERALQRAFDRCFVAFYQLLIPELQRIESIETRRLILWVADTHIETRTDIKAWRIIWWFFIPMGVGAMAGTWLIAQLRIRTPMVYGLVLLITIFGGMLAFWALRAVMNRSRIRARVLMTLHYLDYRTCPTCSYDMRVQYDKQSESGFIQCPECGESWIA